MQRMQSGKRILHRCPGRSKNLYSIRGNWETIGKILLAAFQEMDRLSCSLEKIYVYANQRYHEDTGNHKYQELSARAARLEMEVSQALSFAEPEIMEIPEERLELFYEQVPGLEQYRRKLDECLRMKPHILSKEMEETARHRLERWQTDRRIFFLCFRMQIARLSEKFWWMEKRQN